MKTQLSLLAACTILACGASAQTPGSFDESFQAALPNHDALNFFGLAVQSDGKIVVGGTLWRTITLPDGHTTNSLVLGPVFRLRSDGALDETFTNRLDFNPPCLEPDLHPSQCFESYHLAVDPQGRILISGNFDSLHGVPRPGLARLNTDGTLDSSFIPKVNRTLFEPEWKRSFLALPDGAVLVATADPDGALEVLRLKADGSVDSDFNMTPAARWRDKDGIAAFPILAVQSDGKILVAVTEEKSTSAPAQVIRLNTDGRQDLQFAAVAGLALWIGIQSDGRIIISRYFIDALGNSSLPPPNRFFPNGTLDRSFKVSDQIHLADPRALLDSRGHIFYHDGSCNGDCDASVGVVKLKADGARDTSFQNALFFLRANTRTFALQPDGKVIVAGFIKEEGPFIRRLHGNGEPYLWPGTLKRTQSGLVQFELTAAPDRTLVAEATSEIKNGGWVPLATFPPAANRGAMTVPDPDAAKFPQRFYRAVAR